ncbi:MAG: diguanylate cyclase [Oceanisphaera sp.]|uniref:sensor domain-containing diguanylate cyclase n=1 Tax=Oceanisphaera sp. TaxID=1929979 RepID=UPI003C7324B1
MTQPLLLEQTRSGQTGLSGFTVDLPIKRLIFKRFVAFFVLFCVIVLALAGPIYWQYAQEQQQRLLAQEETSVVATTQMIQKEMYEQLHLLDLLKNSPAMVEYLSSGSATDRTRLEVLFKNTATTYSRFDQIRLLDNSGHELVRVNTPQGEVQVVPSERLQDKSHRYYFTEAKALAADQVFVSRMDLNVEQGVIEQPHKPMLRFVTPVLDADGDRAGVLILNFMAQNMLERFRLQMSRRIDQQGMLLDPQGFWLSNHKRSNEWGADLDNPTHNFATLYPDAWPSVAAQESGVVETAQGLFRFQSINPFAFSLSQKTDFRPRQGALLSDATIANTAWKLVIFLPKEVIQAQSVLYQPLGRTVLALIVLSLAGVAWLLAYNKVHKLARRRYHQAVTAELSDLYEHAPCGYHSLDTSGHFIRINQTELAWLGYDHEEVVGQPFVNFLTPDSQLRFNKFFTLLKTEQEIDNIVLEMQCKDGSTFYVSTSATSLNDQKGHFAIARTSVFDITDRIQLERKLEQLANMDALTHISNRRHFYERGELEFQRAVRYKHALAILMFDIDYFKRVNDTYGHDGGDVVLKQLAKTVQDSLRDLDVFARFGGEEFIALLPELSAEQAALVAERLRREIAEMPVIMPSGETMNITVSIGFAMLTAQDKQLDAFIKKADLALYQAKEQGRNRVIEFNADSEQ